MAHWLNGIIVVNTIYTVGVLTDHLAFYIAVNLINQNRGKDYWKFNSTLLRDTDYPQFMNSVIAR